jgi:hypothetical protein
MLDLKLPQSLGPGQGGFESVDAAIEVILGFVEDFLGLQNLQDTVLTLQYLLGEEKFGQFLHSDLGLLSLRCEKVSALGRRGLQMFHPLRSWRHFDRLIFNGQWFVARNIYVFPLFVGPRSSSICIWTIQVSLGIRHGPP